jgi:hypothetical protein
VTPTGNEHRMLVVERTQVHPGYLVLESCDRNIDLRAPESPRGKERIDPDDTQLCAGQGLGKVGCESRELDHLPGVRDRERELARGRCGVERVTMDRKVDLSQRATEGRNERCRAGCGDDASATSRDQRRRAARATLRSASTVSRTTRRFRSVSFALETYVCRERNQSNEPVTVINS